MVKSIYQIEDDTLKQQFIKNNEEIPDGWTTDLDSLEIEQEPSEIEQLQKETEEIHEKITQGQEDIATVGAAVAEIFEMLSNGGEEQDG